MFKFKNMTYLALILFLAMSSAATSFKAMAQDDDSPPSEDMIMPPSSTATPPVNMDEGDSNFVSGSEDYDG